MRILLLSPYPPYPPHGGGSRRIYQFICGLHPRHELTCLTFAPNYAAAAALEPLRAFCQLEVVAGPPNRGLARRAMTTLASPLPDMALRNASRDYGERLSALCQAQPFDLVQAESIEMAGYGGLVRRMSAASMPGRRPPLLVLDQFNAEYLLQQRAFLNDLRRLQRLHAAAYSFVQWNKLVRYERALMRDYDAVVAVSEEDSTALRRLDHSLHPFVVPNGVDCAFFAPRQATQPSHEPVLVFTGTMDYRPNVDAVCWFATDVLPRLRARRPDVQLRVVGRSPAPAVQALAANPAITITGEVDDVRPEIAAAAVYIVPMRIGGGVRLKLLEALAMETPVVSTSMGAEGVRGLTSGVHCLLADDAAGFAAAVLRLLDSPELGRSLGVQGRSLVARAYDWSAIVPRLELLYTRLIGTRPGIGNVFDG